MKLHGTKDCIEVELSVDDVLLLGNVLNEVCNGFALPDYELRIGVSESEAHKLLERLRMLDVGGPFRLQLGREEAVALQNALRETLRELGVEEFSTRTGVSFDFGHVVLTELQTWLGR